VRTLDPKVLDALEWGLSQSSTFRELVSILEASDLIVYIERHNRFRPGEGGSFRLAGRAHDYRYARIALSSLLCSRELVVLLAHELQHAVELAQAPDVDSSRKMVELFCRIGEPHAFGYDTQAARDVTRQVASELAINPDR